jgi:ABC-type polysaccharide/polyol phosphate export permease
VLQPLSLVLLYWFVFTYMFPGGTGGRGQGYIYFLVAGLIPWIAINEGVMRSTTSIVENAPMVRKLSFRSELLVVVPNASALIFEAVALGLFLVPVVARGGGLRMLWLLPIAMALQLALQLGVALCLAAIYVFFRDLTQILGFVLSFVFYLSPILYTVPGRFQKFFLWNPMTPLLGLFRSAVLSDALPDGRSIVFLVTVAGVVFVAGLKFFRRAQPSLVDLV